jgi:hypothetical protein
MTLAPVMMADAIELADLEAMAEEISDFVNRRLDDKLELSDLEALAEETKSFVERKLADFPTTLPASKLDALIESHNRMAAAVADLTKILAAPKEIMLDENGQPVGVRTSRMPRNE